MKALENQQQHRMIIYQLLVRLFGNLNTKLTFNGTIEENGVGKFNDISDKALSELKLLGATHIWYTGILEHATMSDFTAYGIQPDDWRLVKGRAGSPFAIKDYFDVSPELAVSIPDRMMEFEQLLERTHAHGLKSIIDFIPNHVARNYHSDSEIGKKNFFGVEDDVTVPFDPQNNFYYLPGERFIPPADYHPLDISEFPDEAKIFVEIPAKVTGNDVKNPHPGTSDWFETVKLNLGVNIFNFNSRHFDPLPLSWKILKEVLTFWVGKGIDGFRCDMAEMVPVEFWYWVIPIIKEQNPDVVFIAEIYKPEEYTNYIYNGKFDYIYDKAGLYDKLAGLLNNTISSSTINECIHHNNPLSSQLLNFLENHDELRVASQHFAKSPWAAIPAMTVCATVSKGPLLIYCGQEVGETADIRAGYGGGNGRTTIYDYWNMPELQKWVNNGAFDGGLLNESQKTLRSFYNSLLNISNQYLALVSGEMCAAAEEMTVSDESPDKSKYLFSYFRYIEKQIILVIVNFNRNSFFNVNVDLNLASWISMGGVRSGNYLFTDLLTGKSSIAAAGEAAQLLSTPMKITIAPSNAVIYNIENQD